VLLCSYSICGQDVQFNDPCACNAFLLPSREVIRTNTVARLSYLRLINRENFEQIKRDAEGGGNVIVKGVPLGGYADYDSFEEARSKEYNEAQFHISENTASESLKTFIQPEAIQAALKCKTECPAFSRPGISCRVANSDEENVTVVFTWRSTPGTKGKVSGLQYSGASIAPGSRLGEETTFMPFESRSIQFIRERDKRFVLSINVGGTTDTVILAPAEFIPTGIFGYWKGEDFSNSQPERFDVNLRNNADFAPGKFGQAFRFRGDAYALIPSSADSRIFKSPQFSVAGWFKIDSPPSGNNEYVLVSKYGNTMDGWTIFLTDVGNGNSVFKFEINKLHPKPDGARAVVLSSPIRARADRWFHVAVTFDGTTARIFVDGKLQSHPRDSSTLTGGYTPTGAPMVLGRQHEGKKYYQGLIDGLQIYDRALWETEIERLARAN
ncbi:MAG TPA: LamG domain-containing protein, partial [Anaerolineales bacterium]|nr:LamG domain-containing protein [Anaerolineales bacterium]